MDPAASSCSVTKEIDTPSPSRTTPAVISCSVKPWSPSRNSLPLPPWRRLFKERGLPHAIRSEKGVPFASPNGLLNLRRLAVWWLRLGITIERIQPGHPQQNGRHERMPRTLKMEAARPAGSNFLQQQANSMPSFMNSTTSARMRLSIGSALPKSISPPRGHIAASENSSILSTIGQLWSPAAEESAFTKRKSISALLSRVKPWASKRSTTVFGWSALWTTISVTSILRRRLCNP
jgi:Integrase core domain